MNLMGYELGNVSGTLMNVMVYFVGGIIVLMILAAMIYYFIVRQKTVNGLEIDFNRRVKKFNGRYAKDKKGIVQFWCGRIRKFIPKLTSEDVLVEGKMDFTILLKDRNGMHHILRIPTWEELKLWYKTIYNLDLESETSNLLREESGEGFAKIGRLKRTYQSDIKAVYFTPNPHENIEWLADKCLEANEEYKSLQWWQHPNVMFLGTAFICMIMFVMTLILKKYWG